MTIFKKNIIASLLLISALTACNTEGPIKLNTDDRNMIDTLSSRKISLLSLEMDQWCRDSAPILKQRIIDSLMFVREQEILKQTQPLPMQ
jgi:predicted small lipoprotein YifL